MSGKIEKMTAEQEAYLPVFRAEYLDIAVSGKKADRERLEAAIADAYTEIGKPKPILLILQSPASAMMAISFMKALASKEFGDQLRGQLGDQLWGQLRGQLRGQKIFDPNYLWGSQDLYWIAWAKFAEHIGVKLDTETSRQLEIMRRIGFECEWWWPYAGFCFASERPIARFDDRRLLHCENGPAIEYGDGYKLYAWHGVRIPEEWIEKKDVLDPATALRWENIEQRRAACEILGWERILRELNAETVNDSGDPEIGVLVEVDIPDIGRERFLRVRCGTGRQFALPVPPDMKTAFQANAWTWGLDEHEFLKPEVRT